MIHTSTTHLIDCEATVRLLWDFLDRQLDMPRRAELEAHLRECAECAEHFRFARDFLRELRAAWPQATSAEDANVLAARIRARLAAEGFRAA
jgi:anti-sigma factor RsiW